MDRLTTHLSASRTFLVYAHCLNMVIINISLSKYSSLNNKFYGHRRSGEPTEPRSRGPSIDDKREEKGCSGIEP